MNRFYTPLKQLTYLSYYASGDAKFPMVVSILAMIFCRLLLAYVIAVHFNMGMIGTWLAMFVDWIVKAVIFVARYLSGK